MSNTASYLQILSHVRGFSRKKILEYIERYGSAASVVEQGLHRDNRLLFDTWVVDDWEEDLELIEKEKVQLISYDNPLYPESLREIPDFPLLLYVKGVWPDDRVGVAVIGTRFATLYGKENGRKLSHDLTKQGITIVSGLARGIDTAAHCGALEAGGRTLAIIGSGISCLYPRENQALAEKICENGAVISELSMNTPPDRRHFPKRNRIISGISRATILVESPLVGGGMLTMKLSEQYNKPCFALPGRIDWPSFEGNHRLIKEKKAELLENAEDLMSKINIPHFSSSSPPILNLSEEERAFLDKLPPQEKNIEELVLLTQYPMMKLNVMLTRLTLRKAIKEFPGKIYKKVI